MLISYVKNNIKQQERKDIKLSQATKPQPPAMIEQNLLQVRESSTLLPA